MESVAGKEPRKWQLRIGWIVFNFWFWILLVCAASCDLFYRHQLSLSHNSRFVSAAVDHVAWRYDAWSSHPQDERELCVVHAEAVATMQVLAKGYPQVHSESPTPNELSVLRQFQKVGNVEVYLQFLSYKYPTWQPPGEFEKTAWKEKE